MERMLDSQKIYSYLKANDWIPADKVPDADLLIISTCAFGEYEDRCCVELIRHYTDQKKGSAKVILAGCLPVINPSLLDGMGEMFVVSPTDLDKLDGFLNVKVKFTDVAEPNRILPAEVSYKPSLKKILNVSSLLAGLRSGIGWGRDPLGKWLGGIKNFIRSVALVRSYINPFLVGARDRLFYLRISRGCLGHCTYCAKKFATGTLQSKPLDRIINEFRSGLELKEKRFFLLTEDAGCYGQDIGTTVIDLLNDLFAAGKGHDFSLIISNLNAEWFIKYYDELEESVIRNQAKVLYVHIPIQSGSGRILRLMNRPYVIGDVERCLLRLRSKVPELKLSTDIMVGFPGETQEDLNLTREFLERVRFDFADIFGYENRPNTPASRLPGRFSRQEIEERRFCLLKVQDENAKTGTVVKKVVEVSGDFIRRKA